MNSPYLQGVNSIISVLPQIVNRKPHESLNFSIKIRANFVLALILRLPVRLEMGGEHAGFERHARRYPWPRIIIGQAKPNTRQIQKVVNTFTIASTSMSLTKPKER
jgi:hypothetical protein